MGAGVRRALSNRPSELDRTTGLIAEPCTPGRRSALHPFALQLFGREVGDSFRLSGLCSRTQNETVEPVKAGVTANRLLQQQDSRPIVPADAAATAVQRQTRRALAGHFGSSIPRQCNGPVAILIGFREFFKHLNG